MYVKNQLSSFYAMRTLASNRPNPYIIENLQSTGQLDHVNTERNLLLKNKQKERKKEKGKESEAEDKETNFIEAFTA